MEMEAHKRMTAPGHPIKFLFHRSSFDLGPRYRNIADWQFERAKPLYRKNLLAHFGCVNAIEFSKDGGLLVSGGDDRRVLLWKLDKALISKEEPKIMQAEHLSNVFSLDFSCSSEKLISAGNDDQVILHDLATGVPLDYFVHEQPVYGASADPVNENIFCSACDDGRILIFDIRESGNDPFCLAKATSAFHSVMFHPVEPRLIVTSNSKEGVSLWDVRMPKRHFVKYGMQNSNQCCMSARFNRMGTQILVLRRRLPPILYSTDSPSHMYQFNHRGYYNSCTMKSCSFAGQDDQYVMSGSDNFDLHVWKIPTPGSDQWVNKAHMVLRGHRSIVNQVRYNYVHNVIASSGVEKIVKLWSPFPMPDEKGGKSPTVIPNESKRRIYTPDDYVSLVMQAGQGHFMSLTFEGGRKTTREDSRMLAFFDALVQRDINGLSDDDSDNFYETSYTSTVYTSPETSVSENDDEDSNPPSTFRTRESITEPLGSITWFARSSRSNENAVTAPTLSEPASASAADNPTNSADNQGTNEHKPDEASNNNALEQSGSQPPGIDGACDSGPTQQTESEEKDATANVITQLIMEKEDIRRKLSSRSNASASNGHSSKSKSDNEQGSSEEIAHCSSSRPLRIPRKSQKNKPKSSKHSEKYSKFRKKGLEMRRRERMEAPVYVCSKNVLSTSSGASETSYSRINELMTRNQTAGESDSSVDSSSSSSSDTSSSDKECGALENQSVIQERKKKSARPKKSQSPVVSSDSSSSDSDSFPIRPIPSASGGMEPFEWDASDVTEMLIGPSTSSYSHLPITKNGKKRPPCQLKEACKAYLQRYITSELSKERESQIGQSGIPSKRARRERPEDNEEPQPTGSSSLVEQVIFKRLGKHKGRNYRKASTSNGSGTPPDSGIDVSKEPEACCSKSIYSKSSTTSKPSSSSTSNGKEDNFDDHGYGQVDSSDSEEET